VEFGETRQLVRGNGATRSGAKAASVEAFRAVYAKPVWVRGARAEAVWQNASPGTAVKGIVAS